MLIYILGSQKETAQALDDKSLEKMIKALAQVLCGCHQAIPEYWAFKNTKIHLKWISWACECLANYEYLLMLLDDLLKEYNFRFLDNYTVDTIFNRLFNIFLFLRDNAPDLPNYLLTCYPPKLPSHTAFPLVMPNKYRVKEMEIIEGGVREVSDQHDAVIESYRNYYSATLYKNLKRQHEPKIAPSWTRREKPKWINLGE